MVSKSKNVMIKQGDYFCQTSPYISSIYFQFSLLFIPFFNIIIHCEYYLYVVGLLASDVLFFHCFAGQISKPIVQKTLESRWLFFSYSCVLHIWSSLEIIFGIEKKQKDLFRFQ